MEGLRAPQVGTPFPQPPPQVNPGRAALAIAASAVIGAGVSGSLADAGRTYQNNYQAPQAVTRNAPIPTPNAQNPAFQGLSGMRAPGVGTGALPGTGGGMPGVAATLAQASGGVGVPKVGGAGGAALAIPALVAAALEAGANSDGFKNSPLGKVLGEIGKNNAAAQERIDKGAEKTRGQIGDAIGDFFNGLKGRKDSPRKGDKFPGKPNPELSNPAPEGEAGVFYRVTWSHPNGGSNTFRYQAPVSINSAEYRPGEGKTYFKIKGVNIDFEFAQFTGFGGGNPTKSVVREDGKTDPPTLQGESGKGGTNTAPSLAGLAPLAALPGAFAGIPATNNPSSPSVPSTGAPKPSEGSRPTQVNAGSPSVASNPVKPGGETSPTVPIVPLPGVGSASTNGQGVNSPSKTVPTLPGVPSAGSASSTVPLFPAQFTNNPNQRNPETNKPIEPEKPTQPEIKKPGEECCKATTEGLEDIKRVLGIKDFPATLPILTGDENRVVNTIPELLLWNTSNVDAVSGLYPISVVVEQPGGGEKTFKLENQSHAFQELFAAILTIAEDADAAVNISARVATEVINTKIAVFQGNDLLKAIQKFMGFAVSAIPRIAKLNFSPTAAGANGKLENDEMAGFLKPSQKSYVGTDLSDKKELLPMLERILNNSEISRMAVWHPLKPGKKDEDNITGTQLRDRRSKPTKAEQKTWEETLKRLRALGVEIEDNSPNKGTSK